MRKLILIVLMVLMLAGNVNAANIVRYVNTASAGGNGTTNEISGANAAYATLSAWEAAEQTDLVAAGNTHTVYCSGTAADTTGVTIGGWTTSSTYKITVIGNNNTGKASTSHYRLTSSGNGITISQRYTVIDSIEVYGCGGHLIYLTGTNDQIVQNCILHDNTTSDKDAISGSSYAGYVARNNLVYNITGTYADGIQFGNGGYHKAYNNTVYNVTRTGISIPSSSYTYVNNNVSIGCGTDFSVGTVTAENYNSSSDTTAEGANSLNNITAANNFTDAANGDFSVKNTSADIYDAGTDLSGTFTTDITGTTRTTWDIGAFEYQSATSSTVRVNIITTGIGSGIGGGIR